MTDDALARELLDAGFTHIAYVGKRADGSEVWELPSLEQLIDACGKACDGIYRDAEEGWYATDGEGLACHGATREEAVARLWLSRNKPA